MENWIGAVIDLKWIVKEIIDRLETNANKVTKDKYYPLIFSIMGSLSK